MASPDSCSIFFFKVGPTFPMKSKITFILYGPFHLPPFFFFSTYHLLKEVLLITLQLKTVKQVNNVTLELRIKPSKIPPLSLTPLLSLIFFSRHLCFSRHWTIDKDPFISLHWRRHAGKQYRTMWQVTLKAAPFPSRTQSTLLWHKVVGLVISKPPCSDIPETGLWDRLTRTASQWP